MVTDISVPRHPSLLLTVRVLCRKKQWMSKCIDVGMNEHVNEWIHTPSLHIHRDICAHTHTHTHTPTHTHTHTHTINIITCDIILRMLQYTTLYFTMLYHTKHTHTHTHTLTHTRTNIAIQYTHSRTCHTLLSSVHSCRCQCRAPQ